MPSRLSLSLEEKTVLRIIWDLGVGRYDSCPDEGKVQLSAIAEHLLVAILSTVGDQHTYRDVIDRLVQDGLLEHTSIRQYNPQELLTRPTLENRFHYMFGTSRSRMCWILPNGQTVAFESDGRVSRAQVNGYPVHGWGEKIQDGNGEHYCSQCEKCNRFEPKFMTTCFMCESPCEVFLCGYALTRAGRAAAREVAYGDHAYDPFTDTNSRSQHQIVGSKGIQSKSKRLKPRYDQDRRELVFNGKIVKRFRQSAPRQEAILIAFQKARWASRIVSPFIDNPEVQREAIRGLNVDRSPIRFSGDGDGGVLWTINQDSTQHPPRSH